MRTQPHLVVVVEHDFEAQRVAVAGAARHRLQRPHGGDVRGTQRLHGVARGAHQLPAGAARTPHSSPWHMKRRQDPRHRPAAVCSCHADCCGGCAPHTHRPPAPDVAVHLHREPLGVPLVVPGAHAHSLGQPVDVERVVPHHAPHGAQRRQRLVARRRLRALCLLVDLGKERLRGKTCVTRASRALTAHRAIVQARPVPEALPPLLPPEWLPPESALWGCPAAGSRRRPAPGTALPPSSCLVSLIERPGAPAPRRAAACRSCR